MSDLTPNLDLPFIQAGQAQKHVTHNEALERLDALVQLSVQRIGSSTPPSSAPEGHAWVIGDAPVGAWAGRTGQIAHWHGGGWIFSAPQDGWRIWDRNAGALRVWSGGAWGPLPAPAPDLDNLAGVGVGTTADTTNKLAVASDATLLTHAGSGHQVKVNKATAGDTASMLFQSDWQARAEMGLTGNDDFSIKTSTDGVAFTEALRIDGATGITQTACLTGQTYTLASDSVVDVPTPVLCGMVALIVGRSNNSAHPLGSHSGLIIYDAGASPAVISLGKGNGLELLGGNTLTAASGTIAFSGISSHDGIIQIVNRTTEVLNYNLTFVGGTPGQ